MNPTPGPWHVDDKNLFLVRSAGARQVAYSDGTGNEAHANAKLIATAPELLVALENITAHFAFPRENEELVVMKNARAAIAEARGLSVSRSKQSRNVK